MLKSGAQRRWDAVRATCRPQRRRSRLAAAAVAEPADAGANADTHPEIKDVMDASIGSIDSAVYVALKEHTPHMMPFTRTLVTISIVCSLIIATSQALAYAARYAAQRLTRRESDDEVTRSSTTASLLQPLVVTLPIIGWVIALQRGFTGLGYLFDVCTRRPAWFQDSVSTALHKLVLWAAPLKCHLANITGAVILISLTWTVLILKRRVFKRVVTKLTIDAHGTKEEAIAADLNRSLLPLSTLTTWVIVGGSILLGLKVVGLDPSPLLAVGGVSGIVVGFASQSLLLNLIAGISIFLTRPFIVGDVVQLNNNHLLIAQGTITNISPLRTTLLDDHSESVTLPNKLITDLIITNFGREAEKRFASKGLQQDGKQILSHEVTLSHPKHEVEYDEYVRTVTQGLYDRLVNLPNTLEGSMKVFVSGLNPSREVVVKIVCVGLRKAYLPAERTRQDFFLAIYKALSALEREQLVHMNVATEQGSEEEVLA